MKQVIAQIPIPFSTKHVFLALEEDHLDHNGQLILIDGQEYSAIDLRLPEHPGYGTRGSDALEAIYQALPAFRDIEAGLIRDTTSGCIIY